ncbi:hypothetical protein Pcinc_029975 [Petrolisthes cinctipes]|uniref:protein xylosyltransferase n=1 Tax=Petrolisthes cinctipes TaxID=88211 RepID=A0AAE1EZZ0_PETCI|nr:hypothetical protein Pcinc_029975 [Petrolisthes cinctipes]
MPTPTLTPTRPLLTTPPNPPPFTPPTGKVRMKPMGCFEDRRDSRLLRGFAGQLKRNTPSLCCDICYQRGYVYAGVQFGKECFCGNEDLPLKMKVPEKLCDMPCLGDANLKCGDYLHVNIYQTGLAKHVPSALKGSSSSLTHTHPVRIAFILTVNGRAARQLTRLIKALYHKDHYFFIHVDSRQDYLYREVTKLEAQFTNIQVSKFRLSTIWGGASLLRILLHCMRQVLLNTHWQWDFIINLSESDYPVKSNDELVKFLSNNRERNFLKSHGHDTNKFLQKQGLDRSFLECETHMWRIGERRLPLGIRVDGGSDWLCLNRAFVEYVVTSQSQLVRGLKKVYSYTLLPAESFFHTVLRNSEFCQTFTDNNLHITNWKRKLGCKCQYKHIVDWCGCSPNDFTPSDWTKIEASSSRNLFFARKFEAVISQAIINRLDAWLYTPYYSCNHPSLENYWENRYHHEDRTSGTHDAPLTLYHSAARLGVRSLAQLTRHTHTHKNDAECGLSLEAVEVIEAQSFHSTDTYHATDIFKGLLVQYLVRGVEQTEFHLETWIFPHVKYTLPYEKTTHRLTGLEIGSEYDVKEQMLRDWGSPLGPVSDVTVVTRWTADSGGGGGGTGGAGVDGGVEVEEEVVLTPQLVLTDPNSSPAAKGEVTLDQTEQVLSYTFDLKKPLLPGSWMVSVVMNGEVIATLPFIIIPLQFVQGHHISLHQARTVHGGPAGPYTEDDLSEVLAMIGLPHHNNNNNNNNINNKHINNNNNNKHINNNNNNHHSHNNNNNNNNNNNHLIGSHLLQWIDQLVARFYTIQDTCYVVSASVPECVKVLLDPCDNTPWSTQSPDPKAKLTHVDANNGRIAEPYRIGNKEIL